jgi:solute carrier family 8 (sodium/calcium exchanger)
MTFIKSNGVLQLNLCVFVVLQAKRFIEIPISNDMETQMKDECFEVELYDPSGGAVLGPITKLAVTITNDEG